MVCDVAAGLVGLIRFVIVSNDSRVRDGLSNESIQVIFDREDDPANC